MQGVRKRWSLERMTAPAGINVALGLYPTPSGRKHG
jgi:hypothetical protein